MKFFLFLVVVFTILCSIEGKPGTTPKAKHQVEHEKLRMCKKECAINYQAALKQHTLLGTEETKKNLEQNSELWCKTRCEIAYEKTIIQPY